MFRGWPRAVARLGVGGGALRMRGSLLYTFRTVSPRGPVHHPLLRPKAPSSRPQDIPRACYESAASPLGAALKAAIMTLRPHLHRPFNTPKRARVRYPADADF